MEKSYRSAAEEEVVDPEAADQGHVRLGQNAFADISDFKNNEVRFFSASSSLLSLIVACCTSLCTHTRPPSPSFRTVILPVSTYLFSLASCTQLLPLPLTTCHVVPCTRTLFHGLVLSRSFVPSIRVARTRHPKESTTCSSCSFASPPVPPALPSTLHASERDRSCNDDARAEQQPHRPTSYPRSSHHPQAAAA